MEAQSSVWVRDTWGDEAWVIGTIIERNPKPAGVDIVVELDISGKVLTFHCDHEDTELQDLKLANDAKMDLIEDLINLPHLHEPALLHSLSERYNEGEIYTFTGPILLAVNPFRDLPLYTQAILEEYYSNGLLKGQGLEVNEEGPHVYAIADAAYREMMMSIMNISGKKEKGNDATFEGDGSQSILISGESGAGKTESTKIVMKYLTSVGNPDGIAAVTTGSIMDKVLQSNPILEAFGNARTLRNDNSSRFGKFLELQFDRRGHLLGAGVRTYLLEKVRLPSQANGERCFHIFYQMCKGVGAGKLDAKYGLSACEDFNYINQGNCFDLKHVDDTEELAATLHGMRVMGFEEEEIDSILSIVAGILHLGQLEFASVVTGEGECSQLLDDPSGEVMRSFEHVLQLCALDRKALEAALTSYTVEVRNESFLRRLRPEQAVDARDALAKHLYGHLFNWIVRKINLVLAAKDKTKSRASISVLDIFGFECFQKNSFEQLCINYTNEALQQQFNQFIFKMEQQEYTREGINWSFIEFPDNQDAIELIEGKPNGLIVMLDDECRLPNGNDEKYAARLYQGLEKKHPRFEVSKADKVNHRFGVRHYAGLVTYDTQGFLIKNKDDLPKEAEALFNGSTSDFVRGLFEPEPKEGPPRNQSRADLVKAASGRMGNVNKPSIGTQFKGQLNELMKKVQATRPHYIRCIKPNDTLQPDDLVRARVIEQLRYSGVLEAVRVARSGYPVRLEHASFFLRYRGLVNTAVHLPITVKGLSQETARKFCEELIEQCLGAPLEDDFETRPRMLSSRSLSKIKDKNFTPLFRRVISRDAIQLGKTKVFLRKESYEQLESRRTRRFALAAVKCQAFLRCCAGYRWYQRAKYAAVLIQKAVRCWLAIKDAVGRRQRKAARLIQRCLHGFVHRNRYLYFRWALVKLQTHYRGSRGRVFASILHRHQASIQIQAFYRCKRQQRLFRRSLRRIVALQCLWRARTAKKIYRKMRTEARSVNKLQASNEALKKEIQELRETAMKETNVRNTAEVERLTQRVKELERNLELEKAACGRYEKTVEQQQNKIEKFKADLETQRATYQKLEADHAQAIATQRQAYEEQIALLQSLQSKKTLSMRSPPEVLLQNEDATKAEQLQTSLQESTAENKSLQIKLEKAETKASSLQDRLIDEKENAARYRAQLEQLQGKVERLEEEKRLMQSIGSPNPNSGELELNEALSKKEELLEMLRKRATDAEINLARKESELEAIAVREKEMQEAQLENKRLMQKMTAQEREHSQLAVRLQTLEEERKARGEKGVRADKLKQQIASSDVTSKNLSEVNNVVTQLYSKLEDEQKRSKRLDQELRKALEEQNRVESQVTRLSKQLTARETDVTEGSTAEQFRQMLMEEKDRTRKLELQLKEAGAKMNKKPFLNTLSPRVSALRDALPMSPRSASLRERFASPFSGRFGAPAEQPPEPPKQVQRENTLSRSTGIAAKYRQTYQEKQGLVPKEDAPPPPPASLHKKQNSFFDKDEPIATDIKQFSTLGTGGVSIPAPDRDSSPATQFVFKRADSIGSSRSEVQLEDFKKELVRGIECYVWEGKVQEALVHFRLEMDESNSYFLRWDYSPTSALLHLFSKKGQAIHRLQFFEIQEVRYGHQDIEKLKKSDASKFMTIVSVTLPSSPERYIVVKVDSRERRNNVVWGLRKLTAEFQAKLRANVNAMELLPEPTPKPVEPPRKPPHRGGKERSLAIPIDTTHTQEHALPNSPQQSKIQESAGMHIHEEEFSQAMHEMAEKLVAEKEISERVTEQMLCMADELSQKEGLIKETVLQIDQLRGECAKLEKKNAEYSRTRLDIIKKLQDVQLDREELKEENENLKEELAELRRIQQDLALRMNASQI